MSDFNGGALSGGFLRGFETLDRSFARKDAQESRDKAEQRQVDQTRINNDFRERQSSLREAETKKNDEYRGATLSMAKDNHETAKKANNLSMQNSEWELADKKAKNRLMGKLANGNFDFDDEDFSASDQLGLEWNHFIDPKGQSAITKLEEVMNPQSGTGLSDPAAVEAFDYVFKNRVNQAVGQKTKDGKTITASRVVGGFPTKDGKHLGLELELTLDDGTTYKAPVSKNRSTADDDAVLLIPIKSAMDQVQSRVLINRAFNESPENRAKLQSSLEKRLGVGADSKDLSATGKTVRDLMALGVDKESSINLATQSKSDPASVKADIYKALVKANADTLNESGRMTDDEIWAQTNKAVENIFGKADKNKTDPKLSAIMDANPGKSQEWAEAYMKYLSTKAQ